MTRKELDELCRSLKGSKPEAPGFKREGWYDAVVAVANAAEKTTANFDRTKFLARACGH